MSQIHGETPIDESIADNDSTREKEPKKKAFMIYRDNGLFQVISPALAEGFSSLGYQVIEQAFPEGTSEEEIARWAEEHQQEITGNKVFSDKTFERILDGPKRESYRDPKPPLRLSILGEYGGGELDYIVTTASAKAILGDAAGPNSQERAKREHEKDTELSHKSFVALVQRIISKPENVPQKVAIIKFKLLDHGPFNELGDEDQAAKVLKEWLIEAGVKADSIVFDDEFDEVTSEDYNHPGNWIIVDRHNIGVSDDVIFNSWTEKQYPHNAKLLQMPLGNLYTTAIKEKLLEARAEELQKVIPETIREMNERRKF